jgi:hypothetical protein
MPQRSIESYGVGQSGYTAGRNEGDPSLGIEDRNKAFPSQADEDKGQELGVDERFTGAGGPAWVPDEDTDDEAAEDGKSDKEK